MFRRFRMMDYDKALDQTVTIRDVLAPIIWRVSSSR